MEQETGIAGPAGVLCPGEMELAGSEDSSDTWEAGSDSHSDVDVEGSCYRLFRLLWVGFYVIFEEVHLWYVGVFLHSCLKQLRGEMLEC